MTLEESLYAQEWLKQFDAVDREVARQLLRRLRLVSHSEFEQGVQNQIEKILQDVGTENVALMTVTEAPNKWATEGDRRIKGSSAARVAHCLENVRRVHGNRILANPTLASMKAERVRNIVLVEDFIGSGQRVSKFWENDISPSIKSWVSYGWTKIWIVAYSALSPGLRIVQKTLRKLPDDRIRIVLPPYSPGTGLTEAMRMLAIKYAEKIRKGRMPLGFGDGGATIIFEHGCPNNVPALLWAGAGKYKPFFPNRGIPVDVAPLFTHPNDNKSAEILWDSGQYLLALLLLKNFRRFNGSMKNWELIIALSLASRSKWSDDALSVKLELTIDAIVALRKRAYSLNLLNIDTHILTAFGRDFLERLRKPIIQPSMSKIAVPKLSNLYYPDTCEGIPKHQSSEVNK